MGLYPNSKAKLEGYEGHVSEGTCSLRARMILCDSGGTWLGPRSPTLQRAVRGEPWRHKRQGAERRGQAAGSANCSFDVSTTQASCGRGSLGLDYEGLEGAADATWSQNLSLSPEPTAEQQGSPAPSSLLPCEGGQNQPVCPSAAGGATVPPTRWVKHYIHTEATGVVAWWAEGARGVPGWRKMEDTVLGWVWVRRERMWTQGHGSSTGEEHGLNPKAVVEAPRKRQQKGPRWPAEKGMESQGGGKWNPVLKQWICGKIGPSNREVRKYFREKAWCF